MVYKKGNFTMQKIIDYYFLIVSSVISIMSLWFCIQDNNWDNILLFCFSTIVSILYIINVLKTSAFFRLVVKCVSVLLSVIMALVLPISLIMLTFRYEIVFYLAICFCILNIILSLCMKTEVS
jgi:hypothetical protein